MIPYFTLTRIPLGPLTIQVWGLFVAIGLAVAAAYAARLAVRAKLDKSAMLDFALAIIVAALVGSRVFYVLAYDPGILTSDPLEALRVWHGGFSSFGGFIGAAVAAVWFAKKRHINFTRYGDIAAYVLPLGYGIGRIGCFLIHDHLGVLCPMCALAVQFPDGARLDHGLLLSLTGFGIFAVFVAVRRFSRREPGAGSMTYLPLFMLLYGCVRFVLDFFRARDLAIVDAHYFGLTPAQYGCLALVAGGIALFFHAKKFSSAYASSAHE